MIAVQESILCLFSFYGEHLFSKCKVWELITGKVSIDLQISLSRSLLRKDVNVRLVTAN